MIGGGYWYKDSIMQIPLTQFLRVIWFSQHIVVPLGKLNIRDTYKEIVYTKDISI